MSQTKPDRIAIKEEWVSHFEMLEGSLGQDNWSNLKREAIGQFDSLGFPTTRHEEWKYTSVAEIIKTDFAQAFLQKDPELSQKDLEKFLIPGFKGVLMVFVNGFFVPELSDLKENDSISASLKSIKDVLQSDPETIGKHLGKHATFAGKAFTALNTAFSQDGAYIHIAKGKAIEVPIHILHLTDARKGNLVYNTRNLIVAEEASQAKLVVSHHTLGSHKGFVNTVTEIVAEQNSILDVYFIENDKGKSDFINETQIVQDKNSVVNTVTITLEGQFVRNNLNFLFREEHCECHLYGLYFLNAKQHVDNHTMVDHAVPNCFSNELYKGVLDGSSTAVFNGKVMVRNDAQKTNAFQSNKNILLSNNATINTKPQLEIWADDVKCSHGATTGKMDQDAMFYLKARGIPEKTAQALLTEAFASDVLENIKIDSLKRFLKEEIKIKMKNRN